MQTTARGWCARFVKPSGRAADFALSTPPPPTLSYPGPPSSRSCPHAAAPAPAAAASLVRACCPVPPSWPAWEILRAGRGPGPLSVPLGAVAPRVSATPRHPLRTWLPRVPVTPPFSTRGHAPESASLPPPSGTGWGHRQGGDSYTWRPGPGTFWRFGPVQGQLFSCRMPCS